MEKVIFLVLVGIWVVSIDRKLRSFPGWQPFPLSQSWIFPSSLYLNGTSVPPKHKEKWSNKSVPLMTSDETKLAMNCGNDSNGWAIGICSLPRVANPWYAETKRLCPLIWFSCKKGGLWDVTVLAYSDHCLWICWGKVRQAARARRCTCWCSICNAVPVNTEYCLNRQ